MSGFVGRAVRLSSNDRLPTGVKKGHQAPFVSGERPVWAAITFFRSTRRGPGRGPASAEPPARRRSLMALAAIAATVGAVGEPLLGSVKAALELLGR